MNHLIEVMHRSAITKARRARRWRRVRIVVAYFAATCFVALVAGLLWRTCCVTMATLEAPGSMTVSIGVSIPDGGVSQQVDPLRPLLNAIRQVESGGDDHAVGDGGRSKGPYQIGRAYWQDGGGDPAEYDRLVWDRVVCEKVMLRYWQRYCPAAFAERNFEVLARVHNGGPKGAEKKATLVYWRKVKAAMEERP